MNKITHCLVLSICFLTSFVVHRRLFYRIWIKCSIPINYDFEFNFISENKNITDWKFSFVNLKYTRVNVDVKEIRKSNMNSCECVFCLFLIHFVDFCTLFIIFPNINILVLLQFMKWSCYLDESWVFGYLQTVQLRST